jgi:hypothetical protein
VYRPHHQVMIDIFKENLRMSASSTQFTFFVISALSKAFKA